MTTAATEHGRGRPLTWTGTELLHRFAIPSQGASADCLVAAKSWAGNGSTKLAAAARQLVDP